MKKTGIRLGVNVDHVATLRQVRGGTTPYPHLLEMVQESVRAGADQITIHLREDERHIQKSDLVLLSAKCPVDLNLEMAVTPRMIRLAKRYRPQWCCFVPEKRRELTTEGGLDVVGLRSAIQSAIQKLQSRGIEISLFIAPDLKQVRASFEVGADAVEFHTGHWVRYQGARKNREWSRLKEAAELAHSLGLRVHAGHGLDFVHSRKIRKLPHLKEVNIGHFLVCEALRKGLGQAVREMVKVLRR
ncbi:MAG: pyridoxine 5'-phosphate synthase [Bdellovibrionales bacterium]